MFRKGKSASPPTSFVIAANIVKSKVVQERTFASSTVVCKGKVSVVSSDLYALPGLAVPQQRQRKMLFRHTNK